MLLLLALLTLKVTPQHCFPPCEVRIVATVEPHPLNRWVVIQMDGDNMFQSTAIQLEGDQAMKTQRTITFKGIPVGDYTVLGVLFRAQPKSEVARVAVPVHVIGDDSANEHAVHIDSMRSRLRALLGRITLWPAGAASPILLTPRLAG